MRDFDGTLSDRLPPDQAQKLYDLRQDLLLKEGDPGRIQAEIPAIIQDLRSPEGIPMKGHSFRIAAQIKQNSTS